MDYQWLILCQWSRGTQNPPHREMWLFIPSSYPSAARQSTQHWQCSPGPDWCWLNQFPRDLPEAGCAAGALHFGFQNQKKHENIPLLPQGISAAYFRAVWGQPQNTSADVLGAPGCSRIPCPCPRRSLLQCRMQEERPVHTANAEAVIYSPSRMQKCTKQDASQSSFGAASYAGTPKRAFSSPHPHQAVTSGAITSASKAPTDLGEPPARAIPGRHHLPSIMQSTWRGEKGPNNAPSFPKATMLLYSLLSHTDLC